MAQRRATSYLRGMTNVTGPTRSSLPTGTVTFLFTDIEGSTRLLHALGDRFDAVLNRHHEVLRGALIGRGGVEVATEGDSFFVVFPSPSAAVETAILAQRALHEEDWGDGVELRVRMGIHTGNGKLVGDNYGGLDVHRAARISSAGYGGQVLLSEETRALVARTLPEGVQIIDLGLHGLKDLDEPEHLYQLCIDGLQRDFPPPRSVSTSVHNLPAQLSPFVGREGVLKEVCELLETSRILTLTGPGGTGKTRLSIAVAERAVGDFPDGAFIVFLASVDDQRLVGSTIAHAIGIQEHGTLPIEDVLKDHLADKTMLLVLDNFEQIVSAAPYIGELAASSPGLKILVSSRIALRIAGEQEYPVPPMSLPDASDRTPVAALSEFEGVELFVQRARAVQPRFELTEENAAAVAEICRRLDGLPLAIELATARLRLMTPQEMVKRLGEGTMMLGGGARNLPERQQTLRGAIAWSYDLLDEDDKRFFRSMGIFSAGFTVEAAEAVIDPGGGRALDAIEVMIDNSLLLRLETELWTTRFRMLQTIREFAIECIQQMGEQAALHDLHTKYVLELVLDRAPKFTVDISTLDEIELEHDNIRVAMRWAIDSGQASAALRMGTGLWRFWQARGYLAEGRRLLTEILSMAGASEPTPERAHAVMALGSVTYWQNDFVETRRRYEEALDIFRGSSDEEGMQEALYNSGFLGLLEYEPDRARAIFEESRALAERMDDTKGLANAAWGLAMAAIQRRDWAEASKWGAECARRYDEANDVFGQGLALFVQFQVARHTGRYEEAREFMRVYGTDSRGRENTEAMASVELIAEIDLLEGNMEHAVRLAAAGAAFREEYGGGSPAALVELSDVRGIATETLGPERVEELWAEGWALSRDDALKLAFER